MCSSFCLVISMQYAEIAVRKNIQNTNYFTNYKNDGKIYVDYGAI